MFERTIHLFESLTARIPGIGPFLVRAYQILRGMPPKPFDSRLYWENRYRRGGNSGPGSYDKFADFKAGFLNAFIQENGISSVIEFGCGDGNQLHLEKYPRYLGFDVSTEAVKLCRAAFRGDRTKRFAPMSEYRGERAPLSLSLDVVFHLVEDPVFEKYMSTLFDSSERFVIVYSSNSDEQLSTPSIHVRHRRFTDWIARQRPAWRLIRHVPNIYPFSRTDEEGSFSDFYVFEKIHPEPS
jgi:hypothetical protein